MSTVQTTQNSLLLNNLLQFYKKDNYLELMLSIINGVSPISLRIVDWFATNYSKQYYVTYSTEHDKRFKVYNDYKLKLRAYSKKRFDPFWLDFSYLRPPKNGYRELVHFDWI